MLEVVYDCIATGVTRVVLMAVVLQCGNQMEKTTTLLLFLDSAFQRTETNARHGHQRLSREYSSG
jgi:hypothetical protein